MCTTNCKSKSKSRTSLEGISVIFSNKMTMSWDHINQVERFSGFPTNHHRYLKTKILKNPMDYTYLPLLKQLPPIPSLKHTYLASQLKVITTTPSWKPETPRLLRISFSHQHTTPMQLRSLHLLLLSEILTPHQHWRSFQISCGGRSADQLSMWSLCFLFLTQSLLSWVRNNWVKITVLMASYVKRKD